MEDPITTKLKCVAVGDGAVGKTCLLIRHVYGKFPGDYVPTTCDVVETSHNVDGKDVSLYVWDTAGGEDYWRIRPLSYPGSDAILVCFSVASRVSFENITEYWYPELRKHIPKVPTVLVGCKCDLRAKKGTKLVTPQEAKAVAQKYGALYLETSALDNIGVQECMESLVAVGLAHHFKEPEPPNFWDQWFCC